MIKGYGLALRLQYLPVLNHLGMFGIGLKHCELRLNWVESVSGAYDNQVFLGLITGKTFASVD